MDLFPAANKQQETMSSLEISQLTGKRHNHVLRDIKKTTEAYGLEVE